ncbi:MAG TPA: hypothetical protein VFF68_06575, partial [Anaerolineaceae bacterium]|nr:hypothetical protein [Anaerolineaceae bacterium]
QMRLEALQDYLKVFPLDRAALTRTLATIDTALADFEGEQMGRPDAELIRREIRNTAALLRHACRRGPLLFGEDSPEFRRELAEDIQAILAEFRSIWLERNRLGGLEDCLKRFAHLFEEYGVTDLKTVP